MIIDSLENYLFSQVSKNESQCFVVLLKFLGACMHEERPLATKATKRVTRKDVHLLNLVNNLDLRFK